MEKKIITVTMTSDELKELCIQFAKEEGQPKKPGSKDLIGIMYNLPERGLHEVTYTIVEDPRDTDAGKSHK